MIYRNTQVISGEQRAAAYLVFGEFRHSDVFAPRGRIARTAQEDLARPLIVLALQTEVRILN